MFQGFSGATVDFMWGIRFNNEKGWFEAHKEEYLTTFQRPMKALADEVYVAFTDRHPDLYLYIKTCPAVSPPGIIQHQMRSDWPQRNTGYNMHPPFSFLISS